MIDFDPRGRRPLGIGMVGYGFMGAAHSHAWRTAPRFFPMPYEPVLVGISGRSSESLDRAAARYGWQSTETDWRVLLDRADIDVIDICAPGAVHAEIAIAALAAGKHVLCEKPLANTVLAAELMTLAAAAGRRNGHQARISFSYRFAPAVVLAKELVQAGRIGVIRQIRAQYLQDWLVNELTPMSWRLDKEQAGSGSLGDIAAHLVDMAQHITNQQVIAVSGSTHTFVHARPHSVPNMVALGGLGANDSPRSAVTVDDSTLFTARLSGGAIGAFEATRMATGRRNALRLEVSGTKGSVAFDYDDPNALQFFDGADPDREAGFRRIDVTGPSHPYGQAWWPPGHGLGYEHGFVHEIAGFMQDIADNGDRTPDFADGLAVQRILDAVERSAADGSRWVSISTTVQPIAKPA